MHSKDITASPTAQKLASLYTLLWNLCAGWNRVRFRAKQIVYILTHSRVELQVAPLGDIDAFAMVADGRYIICLNRTLCPGLTHEMLKQRQWDQVGLVLTSRARFVLIHEFAHLILHVDTPEYWRQGVCGRGRRALWLAERDMLNRNPRNLDQDNGGVLVAATMREVEADFCALVAMAPDQELAALDSDGHLDAGHVLRIITDSEEERREWGEAGLALAAYRIEIYRKFAYLLWSISTTIPIDNIGKVKDFVAVTTMQLVCIPKEVTSLLETWGTQSRLRDIAVGHPLVERRSDVRKAVETGWCEPFAYLPCRGELSHTMREWQQVVDGNVLTPRV